MSRLGQSVDSIILCPYPSKAIGKHAMSRATATQPRGRTLLRAASGGCLFYLNVYIRASSLGSKSRRFSS